MTSSSSSSSKYFLSQELEGHTKSLRCVCVLPDCRIATGGLDGVIIIWSRENSDDNLPINSSSSSSFRYSPQTQLRHHTNFVYCVAASEIKEPINLFSGGKDKRVHRVTAEGDVMMTFDGHEGPVSSIAERNDKEMISGSWDGMARVWNTKTGRCKYKLEGHSHAVCVAYLSSCKNYITGSQDKSIRFWQDDQLVRTLKGCHGDIVRAFATHSGGFYQRRMMNWLKVGRWMEWK